MDNEPEREREKKRRKDETETKKSPTNCSTHRSITCHSESNSQLAEFFFSLCSSFRSFFPIRTLAVVTARKDSSRVILGERDLSPSIVTGATFKLFHKNTRKSLLKKKFRAIERVEVIGSNSSAKIKVKYIFFSLQFSEECSFILEGKSSIDQWPGQ